MLKKYSKKSEFNEDSTLLSEGKYSKNPECNEGSTLLSEGKYKSNCTIRIFNYIEFVHVYRNKNKKADELSNIAVAKYLENIQCDN
jgi:hypothetical protein